MTTEPAAELRLELAELRGNGVPFPVAWPIALVAATADLAAPARRAWLSVLEGTREAWRLAYDGVDDAAAWAALLAQVESFAE